MAISLFIPPHTWARGEAADAMRQNVTQEIVLRAIGLDSVRLDGECVVKTASAERTVTIAGELPLEERFAGVRLNCRLTATGSADIEVRMGGNVSRTRTSGGTVRLSVGA